MCLGTFSRLRRSLATSTLYAAVRILAEHFLLYRKAISCKVKKQHQKHLCFRRCYLSLLLFVKKLHKFFITLCRKLLLLELLVLVHADN